MKDNFVRIFCIVALLAMAPLRGFAVDISDDVTDVEEITADSEAARGEARAARLRVAQEREENAQELKNVRGPFRRHGLQFIPET